MFRAVEFECDRLVDGYRHGFRCGVAVVANVNRNRLSFHSRESQESNAVFLLIA